MATRLAAGLRGAFEREVYEMKYARAFFEGFCKEAYVEIVRLQPVLVFLIFLSIIFKIGFFIGSTKW
jgi:hypothetical protein